MKATLPRPWACLDGIDVWYPTINADGTTREGAWVAEATNLLDLSEWPDGRWVNLRKERPHPRCTADLPGRRRASDHRLHHRHPCRGGADQLAGLDLRHRRHGGGPDPAGKGNQYAELPLRPLCSQWLEIVMTGMDLVAWSKLLGFADEPDLARCEIATFRYRCCTSPPGSAAAPRQTRLRIDQTCRWAEQITQAWHQIRAAFT